MCFEYTKYQDSSIVLPCGLALLVMCKVFNGLLVGKNQALAHRKLKTSKV